MKLSLLIFIASVVFSCQINRDTTSIFQKKHPCELYRNLDSVQVELQITPTNPDSIIAELKFSNTSSMPFTLYKPLMPDQVLHEKIFSIFEDSSNELISYSGPHIHKVLCHDTIFPTVKPYMHTSNLLILAPKQSSVFRVNLSRYYDFNSFMKKSRKYTFNITYSASLPVIIGNKKLKEKDTADHQLKPVYYDWKLQNGDCQNLYRVRFTLNHTK